MAATAAGNDMPLWAVMNVPSENYGWDTWYFAHGKDHEEIATAIQTQKGINLTRYNLQEFDKANPDGWLQRHQLAHNEMIAAVQATAGSDLSQLDFNNQSQVQGWIFQNFQDHEAVRGLLKI